MVGEAFGGGGAGIRHHFAVENDAGLLFMVTIPGTVGRDGKVARVGRGPHFASRSMGHPDGTRMVVWAGMTRGGVGKDPHFASRSMGHPERGDK